MTAASQLSIYCGACAVIGERQIYSLTENREARRALDDIWWRGGVNTCLAAGLWNFAGRGVQLDYNPDFSPQWGFQCAFNHPADWVRWMKICVDPYYEVPLLQATDESGYLFCDLQRIWVKYVSKDPNWGMNMAVWPDSFQRYVEAYFGAAIARRVTGSLQKEQDAQAERDRLLKVAKSTDAMNDVTALLPAGNWRQARHGRRGSIERGNPYSLYGGA